MLEMSPPMTTVSACGVTTTVSAERTLMYGAETSSDKDCRSVGDTEEICGWTIISTWPLDPMKGVTFRMMPTSL